MLTTREGDDGEGGSVCERESREERESGSNKVHLQDRTDCSLSVQCFYNFKV